MTINAFPLTWPQGFPRAKSHEKGKFQTSLNGALKNVQESLRLFANDSERKLENLVISSNVTLGVMKPDDPGVSVWFVWDGMGVCIAVDRYLTVEANLQAIHHIIEARRVELRHGTLALVRATFAGFLSLPSPSTAGGFDPHVVIGVPANSSNQEKRQAYRIALSKAHPDKGGTNEQFHRVQDAGKALGLV
jgi:hypothetical protein